MRKKVAIITIDDLSNYGNRLQNFAMQEILKSFECEVSTIRVSLFQDLYYLWPRNKKYCIKQYLYSYDCIKYLVHKIKGRKTESFQKNIKKDIPKVERRIAFEKFNEKFIHYDTNRIVSEPIKKKLYKKYDYVVTGSDQVWNPLYGLPKCAMYLRFVPKRKRIAIAASFGVSNIPQEHLDIVKKYLKGMKYISVREISGQKIVKELTGNKSDLIMDPTLIVEPKVWGEVMEDATANLPEHYILTYFLGEVSSKKKESIEKIAQQKNCEVIWMNSEACRDVYNWGPENFLKAVHGCEYFFTDSFHGCVFALLFHRQFKIFYREGNQLDMFDRIRTLLNIVGLESQIAKNELRDIGFIERERFEKADAILEKERVRVEKIIREVLR